MLRDIGKRDAQVAAVMEVIAAADADVLLLTGFDTDPAGATLATFSAALEAAGVSYPFSHAGAVNSGLRSGHDLDGDGRREAPRDAHGYGRFPGHGGMVVLSRLPLGDVRELSEVLWRDLPSGDPWFPSPEAAAVQRLSSVAHWDVPVEVAGRSLHLLALSATTPVFDGPEDRNGRRGQDELRLWAAYLAGDFGGPPEGPAVVIGRLNVDLADGAGRRTVLQDLLRERFTDPTPRSPGGAAEADLDHMGDPGLDTADWDGPGNLRVDYILPEQGLSVSGAGVMWPTREMPIGELSLETVRAASRGRLVWVDLVVDR